MNRIRELRKAAHITQTDFCGRLGITQGALSGWENGKYEPDTTGWLKLSEIFNVPVDYLMGTSEIKIKEKSPSVNTGTDPELAELLNLWNTLAPSKRSALLQMARALK